MQGAPENLTESLPTMSGLPLRLADFDTFVDAVDYASKGVNGLNYYSARGEIVDQLTLVDMRARSEKLAGRLLARASQRALSAIVHCPSLQHRSSRPPNICVRSAD